MDEVARRDQAGLPVTVEALNQFIIIGKERLNAQKAKIRAIEKTDMAIEAKEAALEDAQDMADILLDAEMKLGGILEAIPPKPSPDSSGKGTFGGRLPSLPPEITKKVSHKAQTLYSHPEIVERAKAEAREAGEIPTAAQVYKLIKTPHVSYNSGENEWYTPNEYVESARRVMGSIDLDPASSEIANQTVKASIFYTKEDGGLGKPWTGNIFLNPPYAAELIKQFAKKYAGEVAAGRITAGVVLVNNATETGWFRDLIECANAVLFTSGRIKFLDPNGKPGAPLQGQAILYTGENTGSFLREFSKFGWGACLTKI